MPPATRGETTPAAEPRPPRQTPPRARKLRVSVAEDTGAGACEQVCPDVFFVNDDIPDVPEEEPHETLWAAACVKLTRARAAGS